MVQMDVTVMERSSTWVGVTSVMVQVGIDPMQTRGQTVMQSEADALLAVAPRQVTGLDGKAESTGRE